MKVIQVLLFVVILTSISIASHQIFYVLPDNSTNVGDLFQPCATLSQYLLDNNGSLPVVSNVEYHFLPGEHRVPINTTLQYLHNFMITGNLNNKLIPTVFSIDLQAYLRIANSTNFSISHIVFKTFGKQYEDSGHDICNVMLSNCFSCKITNVTLLNYGVCGENLGGKSYVSNTVIDFTLCCYNGIYLKYLHNSGSDDHIVTIDKIFMYGNKHCNKELFTGIIIIFSVKTCKLYDIYN